MANSEFSQSPSSHQPYRITLEDQECRPVQPLTPHTCALCQRITPGKTHGWICPTFPMKDSLVALDNGCPFVSWCFDRLDEEFEEFVGSAGSSLVLGPCSTFRSQMEAVGAVENMELEIGLKTRITEQSVEIRLRSLGVNQAGLRQELRPGVRFRVIASDSMVLSGHSVYSFRFRLHFVSILTMQQRTRRPRSSRVDISVRRYDPNWA